MNEDEAFSSLLESYLQAANMVTIRGFPLYEITDGLSKLSLRIIVPFEAAEIESAVKVKNATPKRVVDALKREFKKKRSWTKTENETERFSQILLYSAQQMELLINSPIRILKIKTLLDITKHTYISLKIGVDELEMFNKSVNSGLLNFELFPGRDPVDSVEISYPGEDKRQVSFIRFKSHKLVKRDEREREDPI